MTPSNAELREAVTHITMGEWMSYDKLVAEDRQEVDQLLALFQAHEQQVMHPSTSKGYLMGFKAGQRELLTELLGEAVEVDMDNGGNEFADVESIKAVPVSVIEKYREGL